MLVLPKSIKLLVVEPTQSTIATLQTFTNHPIPQLNQETPENPHLPVPSLTSTLQQLGYDVVTTIEWGTTAIELLANIQPAVVLINLDFQAEHDYMHVAEQCRAMGKPTIYLVASTKSDLPTSARVEDSYTYLLKPCTVRQLVAAIEVTLYRHQKESNLLQTLTNQKEALEDLVAQRTAELQQKNSEMQAVLQAFPDLCLTFAADGTYLDCETINSKDLFCAPDEFLGRKVEEVMPHPVGQQYSFAITRALKTRMATSIEYSLPIDGIVQHYEARIAPLQRNRAIAAIRNISARKKAEEALRESEARFRQITENISQAFFLESLDGQYKLYISPAYEKIWGQTCEDLYKTPMAWLEVVHPEDRDRVKAENAQQLETGEDLTKEYRIIHSDGSIRWIQSRTCIVLDEFGQPYRLAGVSEDITARKEAESRIQQALIEKEILLKEIHHRVKNNLMIISSLLSLQARRMPDSLVKEIFRENENRIFSMSLIHEKLYQSEDLSNINLGGYLQKLAEELFRSFGNYFDRIQLKLQLVPVLVNIETAMPCGLILNELLSNSLKHAFPNDRPGEISIHLDINAAQQLVMTLSDNGIGIPTCMIHTFSSFGLKLVKTLASQLKADLKCLNQAGTSFQFTFTELHYQKRF